jgi:phosphatidylethanolamine/phosphatidyl-N-methylethanolamine N-methyltransferase
MSWTFFREFLRNWNTTGAIAPSSKYLARRIVEAARVPEANCILEIGTGTGAFTSQIRDTMKPQAHYLGIEMNPKFVATLRDRFPNMRFEAAAAQEYDYGSFLGTEPHFDAIVSGLPWTAFPRTLQESILDHVLPRLKPGGVLATFAYSGFHLLPGGKSFHQLLQSRSAQLQTTRTVWRNLPPAFVYAAVK